MQDLKDELYVRRGFLKNLLQSLGTVVATLFWMQGRFGSLLWKDASAKVKKKLKSTCAPLPSSYHLVPATDPVGVAIGYRPGGPQESAQKSQSCKTCRLYTELADAKCFGLCSMLTAGVVPEQAWCRSYQPKEKMSG